VRERHEAVVTMSKSEDGEPTPNPPPEKVPPPEPLPTKPDPLLMRVIQEQEHSDGEHFSD
jgi:hypothetical protein